MEYSLHRTIDIKDRKRPHTSSRSATAITIIRQTPIAVAYNGVSDLWFEGGSDERINRLPIRVGGAIDLYVLVIDNRDGNFVIKYDRLTGEERWVSRLPDPMLGSSLDYESITSDPSGNVNAVGQSGGHAITVKLDPSGETTWIQDYRHVISRLTRPFASGRIVGLDESRNVYTGVPRCRS